VLSGMAEALSESHGAISSGGTRYPRFSFSCCQAQNIVNCYVSRLFPQSWQCINLHTQIYFLDINHALARIITFRSFFAQLIAFLFPEGPDQQNLPEISKRLICDNQSQVFRHILISFLRLLRPYHDQVLPNLTRLFILCLAG
jgi:hypothetical protein